MTTREKAQSRKLSLAILRQTREKIKSFAERDSTTCRLYEDLVDAIRVEELGHRGFGRRLVGDIGTRGTISQAVDLFVCRTVLEPITEGKPRDVSELARMRKDYQIGTFLASLLWDDLVAEFPQASAQAICDRADYCAVIAGR